MHHLQAGVLPLGPALPRPNPLLRSTSPNATHTCTHTHVQVVTDQIRLWDRELRRLQEQRSVLYANFESPELFQEFVAAVGHLAQCVNADKQQVVVPSGAHDTCKAEIKRLKAKMGL